MMFVFWLPMKPSHVGSVLPAGEFSATNNTEPRGNRID